MKGRAFLQTARWLLQHGGNEQDWRTATSRAYYALLLECRDLLEDGGIVIPPKQAVHAAVRLCFSYAADDDLKQIGDALDTLTRLRNAADYSTRASAWFTTMYKTQEAVALSQDALAILDQITADPVRHAASRAALQAAKA